MASLATAVFVAHKGGMTALALILTLMFGPQQAPVPRDMAARETAAEADGMAAVAAMAAVDAPAMRDPLICRQAQLARRRIVEAAARLAERDPDLMAAWAEVDRIAERACSVPAQADGEDALNLDQRIR